MVHLNRVDYDYCMHRELWKLKQPVHQGVAGYLNVRHNHLASYCRSTNPVEPWEGRAGWDPGEIGANPRKKASRVIEVLPEWFKDLGDPSANFGLRWQGKLNALR
jgi:hypothetical protein